MSAAYRMMLTSFWSDPTVKRLVREGKRDAVYLAQYLITNEHGHVSGLYHLPLYIVTGETGIKDPAVIFPLLEDRRWSSGGEWGFAYYDQETEHVWVRSMLRIQGPGEKNAQAAAKRLRSVHGSRLIGLFGSYYPHVAALAGTVAERLPDPVAEPEAEEAPEQEAPKGPREPATIAEARKAWAVYLEELQEVKGMLGLRGGDDPEATPARLKRIAEYIKSHGFERVCDAARGIRFSDWHMGRCADKKHKLSPEVVFSHTSRIHQVENLSGLYRERKAGASSPVQPGGQPRQAPTIPIATFRAHVIKEVEKRKEAGLIDEAEEEALTRRIDGAKTIEALKEIIRDLSRKPA